MPRPITIPEINFQKSDLQPHDYIFVRMWGQYCNSQEKYIVWMQQAAAREKAPINALYPLTKSGLQQPMNPWVILEDLNHEHPFRKIVERVLSSRGQAGAGTQLSFPDLLSGVSSEISVLRNSTDSGDWDEDGDGEGDDNCEVVGDLLQEQD